MGYRGVVLPSGNRYIFRTIGRARVHFYNGSPKECFWGGYGPGTVKLAAKLLEPFRASEFAEEFAGEVLALEPNKQLLRLSETEIRRWVVHKTALLLSQL